MALSLQDGIFERKSLPRDPERLAQRMTYLAPRERIIVEMVLIRGQAGADVARAMGVNPQHMRKLIVRLCRRMASVRFRQTISILPRLKATEAIVARLHFCHDLSMRRIAAELRLPLYQVRRTIDRVTAKIEAIAGLQRFKKVRET